jgi:hypothetical protein
MSNQKMEWVLMEISEPTSTHNGRRTDFLQTPTGVVIRTIITTLDRTRSLASSVSMCLVPFCEVDQSSGDVRLKSLYAEYMAVTGMAGSAAAQRMDDGR